MPVTWLRIISSGTWLGHSYHYFYGSPRASFGQQPTEYPGWKDGREYQTTVFPADGTTPLRQLTNTFSVPSVSTPHDFSSL
jgi:hypothetical protein